MLYHPRKPQVCFHRFPVCLLLYHGNKVGRISYLSVRDTFLAAY